MLRDQRWILRRHVRHNEGDLPQRNGLCGSIARTWIPNERVCRHQSRRSRSSPATPTDFPFRQRVKQLDPRLSLTGNLRRFSG